MARAIVGAGTKAFTDSIFYLTTFTVNTLFFLQINWFMAKKLYSAGWLSSRGRSTKKDYPINRGVINRVITLLAFMPRSARAMITKDIKIFFRDFGQWSQFLIYFGILTIYIFNLRNMPLSVDNVYWKVIITFLNLSATALVLAGFTVRFLFPIISLEGNKIWLLGLAPISFRNVLFQKFTTYLLFILFISEFLMISTNVMLNSSPLLFYISCGIAAMTSVGLVGLSIGLGSLYPNFKEDNTSRIVSGFGGTLNFVIALFYVGFIVLSFALPYFSYEIKHVISEKTFFLSLLAVAIVTITITAGVSMLPMILGYKKLDYMEF
jgi:ABC-2 type transport system permease protein